MNNFSSRKVTFYINEVKNTCKMIYKDETIYCRLNFVDGFKKNEFKNDLKLYAKTPDEISSYNYVMEGEFCRDIFIGGTEDDGWG